jgi:hypothetical protein
MRRLLLMLLLGVLVLPASAQRRWGRGERWQPVRSTSEGLFLEGSLHGTGFTISNDGGDDDEGSGGGLGLRLGYGFNRTLALYLALNGAAIEPENRRVFQETTGEDTYGLGQADLGLQISFAHPRRALLPTLNVALSGVSATIEGENDDVEFRGGGLTLGGGLRYHFSPGLAVNVGLEGFAGTLNEVEVGGVTLDFDKLDLEQPEFSGGRLRFGLTWFPGAGRRR